MSNGATLLAEGWQHILNDNHGFCCEHHRAMYRAIYFAGAMNAMAAATTWQPGIEQSTEIKPACLNMVCEELTAEALVAERECGEAGHA
jgi:hypothetical protein